LVLLDDDLIFLEVIDDYSTTQRVTGQCSSATPSRAPSIQHQVGKVLQAKDGDERNVEVVISDDLTDGTNVRRQLNMLSTEVRRRLSEGDV
jgi:hypothetical protein